MILIIDSILTPYCVERYNALQKKINGGLYVLFQSFTDVNRHWRKFPPIHFEYAFLRDFPVRMTDKDVYTFHINYDLPTMLGRLNPDKVVIIGWDSFASFYCSCWCRNNKRPLVLWSGSTAYEKSWRRTITLPLVRKLIKRCDGFLAYGTRAKEYLISLGANERAIQLFYNTVDVDFFMKESRRWKEQRWKIKAELGIVTSRVLLYCGQLIERKGVFELLEGFRMYKQKHPDWSLLFVGSGLAEKTLRRIIQEQSLAGIYFAGFAEYDVLPKYYAIADAFILPSREEVWGLVINEAMACGLPIITNYAVGAGADLVHPSRNGYIMSECSAAEVKNGLAYLESNNLLNQNESTAIIQDFRLENVLKNLIL